MRARVENIYQHFLVFWLGMLPVFFWPWLVNSSSLGKQIFLATGVVLGLVYGVFFVKKWHFSLVFLWLLAGVFLSGASVVQLSLGRLFNSLYYPFGVGSFILLTLVVLVWMQLPKEKSFLRIFAWWSWWGGCLAVYQIISLLNPKLTVNSVGGVVFEVAFLAGLLWYLVKHTSVALRKKVQIFFWLPVTITVVVGLLAGFYRLFVLGFGVLDLSTSWKIALEIIKNKPILGIGSGNFLEGFLAYRPASFNLSGLWTNNFSQSGIGLLGLVSELGLVGLVWLVFGLVGFFRLSKGGMWWFSLSLIVINLVLPLNLTTLVMLLVCLLSLESYKSLELSVWFMRLILLMLILGIFSLGVNASLAEYFWKKAYTAASVGNGNGAYENLQKALYWQPKNTEIRRLFSQTNLSLARVILLESGKNEEKEVDEEKRNQIVTLLSQAVAEAKGAIGLEPKNQLNWMNLGLVYKSLIGTIDGAVDFATQAFEQAVNLAPNEPSAKLELGGVYYSAGNFEAADRAFEELSRVKGDYANAWYNWAWSNYQIALKNKNDKIVFENRLTQAVSFMKQAVNLVEIDSADYGRATGELAAWQLELSKITNSQDTNNQKGTETQLILPQVQVGEEEKVNLKLE